jgi:hypothetical protein
MFRLFCLILLKRLPTHLLSRLLSKRPEHRGTHDPNPALGPKFCSPVIPVHPSCPPRQDNVVYWLSPSFWMWTKNLAVRVGCTIFWNTVGSAPTVCFFWVNAAYRLCAFPSAQLLKSLLQDHILKNPGILNSATRNSKYQLPSLSYRKYLQSFSKSLLYVGLLQKLSSSPESLASDDFSHQSLSAASVTPAWTLRVNSDST